MLALFFALFIETMAITIAIQITSQGRESFPLFHLGGVVGPIVDVIVVGVFFVVLAIYFRFVHVHADVKHKAFFFAAGIFLGLAMEAMSLIVADGVENKPWFNHLAMYSAGIFIYMFAGFLLAFLIGYSFLISFLGGDKLNSRFHAVWGIYVAGLSLGYCMYVLDQQLKKSGNLLGPLF
jgi:hypothetical protein